MLRSAHAPCCRRSLPAGVSTEIGGAIFVLSLVLCAATAVLAFVLPHITLLGLVIPVTALPLVVGGWVAALVWSCTSNVE